MSAFAFWSVIGSPFNVAGRRFDAPRVVEALPSYTVSFYVHVDVGSSALSALRSIAAVPGQVAADRVITANVRASLVALARLRAAINGAIKMAEQQQTANINALTDPAVAVAHTSRAITLLAMGSALIQRGDRTRTTYRRPSYNAPSR